MDSDYIIEHMREKHPDVAFDPSIMECCKNAEWNYLVREGCCHRDISGQRIVMFGCPHDA